MSSTAKAEEEMVGRDAAQPAADVRSWCTVTVCGSAADPMNENPAYSSAVAASGHQFGVEPEWNSRVNPAPMAPGESSSTTVSVWAPGVITQS